MKISQYEKDLSAKVAEHQKAIDALNVRRNLYQYLSLFDDLHEVDRVGICNGNRGWGANGKFIGSGFSEIEREIITEKYGWAIKFNP